jgi:hypothetical protein
MAGKVPKGFVTGAGVAAIMFCAGLNAQDIKLINRAFNYKDIIL